MKLQKTTKNVFAALALTALIATPALAANKYAQLEVEPWATVTADESFTLMTYSGVETSVADSINFSADTNVTANITITSNLGSLGIADGDLVSGAMQDAIVGGAAFNAFLNGDQTSLAIDGPTTGTVDVAITGLTSATAPGLYSARVNIIVATN